ncbi:MAG: MBL fold metallo-hydrolase [Promethearchaeota archaeon]
MTTIAFHGAIGTVGGNCIIIEEDGRRVMFDNGMNFTAEGEFYKDFLMARASNDMRDYLKLGLVPKIAGVYAKSMITDFCISSIDQSERYIYEGGLQSYEEYLEEHGQPFIDGFFLTHAHMDHVRNLQFMHPDIPVYMSDLSVALLEAMDELSRLDYLQFHPYSLGEYSDQTYFPGEVKKKRDSIGRKLNIMEPGSSVTLDPFTVKAHPVDHSVPGAMAYEITTAAGKRIVYTGDIRFHGISHDKMNSQKFVDEVSKNSHLDVLVSESTRIYTMERFEAGRGGSEETVFEETIKHVRDNPDLEEKLIIAAFPWKSVARFLTVYRVARELGRTIAIQPKLAYLLHKMRNKPILMGINILVNEDIRIYQPRKLSMLYSDGDYLFKKEVISYDTHWDKHTKDYKFFRDVYGKSKHVRAAEIHHDPGKFLLHMQFYDLNELIDIDTMERGGCFFNMRTEPFDEEGEISKKILKNWLRRFNLEFVSIHASGHASGKDLVSMITKFNPRILFPIHGEHPELFTKKFGGLFSIVDNIEPGKEYEI